MISALAFVLLSFSVVVIALAQLHLYRLVNGTDPHLGGWGSAHWPLSKLAAGEQLPSGVIAAIGDEWAGLLVVCSDNHDEFAVVASVLSVANEWEADTLVALRESGSPTGWESRLESALAARTFAMSASDFDTFGCHGTPVLLAVDHGRVIDATHDLASPSGIADRLRYVAAQIQRMPAGTSSFVVKASGVAL